jgi:hypothetical protein
VLVAAAFVLFAHGAREMGQPLARLDLALAALDPRNLPEYALGTMLRMFAGILAPLAFTFSVAHAVFEVAVAKYPAKSVRIRERARDPQERRAVGVSKDAGVSRCRVGVIPSAYAAITATRALGSDWHRAPRDAKSRVRRALRRRVIENWPDG